MKQTVAGIFGVGWTALIVLLNGRAANSQGFVGGASTRILSRGLATTISTTSSANTCPDEVQTCLDDAECSACFQKPESTFCVSEFLEGDLTCEGVFSGYYCCEYGDEASCVDNALLLELFECNASEAGCTLADSCGSESAMDAMTDDTTEFAIDAMTDATTDATTEAEESEPEIEAETATDAGISVRRSGAGVLCSTVVTGLLAAALNTLLL